MAAPSSNKDLLDQLMGRNRDLLPNERPRTWEFDDPEVCQDYLNGFCPKSLLANTKSSIGICKLDHDDELAKRWKDYRSKHRFPDIEESFCRVLDSLISDLERRLRKNQERIRAAEEKEESSALRDLDREIASAYSRMQSLGEAGDVNESYGMMDSIMELESRRAAVAAELSAAAAASSQFESRKMELCLICGALLVTEDTVQNQIGARTRAHLEGKQHQGYILIREKFKDLSLSLTAQGRDWRAGSSRSEDLERPQKRFRLR